MKICPKCDAEYREDAIYCSRDGASLIEIKPTRDPLVGQVINGKYRIIKELDEGGMGKVYQAEHVKIGMKVAIKVVHAHYAQNPDFVRRFHQEARLVASLKHRNIVTLHDFDQMDNGSLFIVMEFVEGRTLRAVIEQEKPLEIQRVLSLGVQIAEGLGAAHRAGVIHRDIKPDNIMIVEGDEVRIMDFGLAREMTRLTPSSVIVGSPAYMAPEQAKGERPTEATDIYALGIVLYEMLSGEVPFKGSTPEGVLRQHMSDTPAPLRRLRRDLPNDLERIVMQALEKTPENRPGSAQEVAQKLRELEVALGHGTLHEATVLLEPERPRVKLWTWRSGVGAAIVTVVSIIAVLIWSLKERVVEGPGIRTGSEIQTQAKEDIAQPAKIIGLTAYADRVKIQVGERTSVKVKVKYSDGSEKQVTEGIDWQSSDPSVVKMTPDGHALAQKEGNAQVTARYAGSVSATLALSVTGTTVTSTPADLPECSETVAISVSRGPRFSWTPPCRVAYLEVGNDGSRFPDWKFKASSNTITPNIQYGIPAPKPVEAVPPKLLEAGKTYFVTIGITLGVPTLVRDVGSADFTPSHEDVKTLEQLARQGNVKFDQPAQKKERDMWERQQRDKASALLRKAEELAKKKEPSILVKGIRITGNRVITTQEFEPIIRPFIGKHMSLTLLQELAEVVTIEYRKRGYNLARATIPEQRIESGVVEIGVLEAWIEEIKIVGNRSVPTEYIRKFFADLEKDRAFKQSSLEKGVLALNRRVPGLRAIAIIQPGKQPGGSVILVNVEEGPPTMSKEEPVVLEKELKQRLGLE